MGKKLLVGLVTGWLMFGIVMGANASLTVTFDRLSDTEVRMTGTGTVTGDPSGVYYPLWFDDLFASIYTPWDNVDVLTSSNMEIGGMSVDFARLAGPDYSFPGVSNGIYMGPLGGGNYYFSGGDVMNGGYVDMLLTGAATSTTFVSGGATGDIYRMDGTAPWGHAVTGTWTMVDNTAPVPVPTTMLLLGSGLIGLVGFRKKLKK